MNFTRTCGKHFFLANRATFPLKKSTSSLSNWKAKLINTNTIKSSIFPWLNRPHVAQLKPQQLQLKQFHSSGQLQFIRISNYNYNRNYNTLKQALIFSGLFIVGTTVATPYIFQYTPLAYFNKHPSHLVYGLIGINLAVFGLWQVPKYWRVLSRYALLEKDVLYSKWSIVGSTFSHQEFWHFAINMLALYSFGASLANMVGASTFTQLYLNSGVVASLASIAYPIIFKIPITAASLGASGSLFGVFATFAYLVPTAKIMVFVFPIPGGAWVAFLGSCIWNAAGCAMRWGSFDYAAHLGGSLAGVLYGWWIAKKVEEQRSKRLRAYRF